MKLIYLKKENLNGKVVEYLLKMSFQKFRFLKIFYLVKK